MKNRSLSRPAQTLFYHTLSEPLNYVAHANSTTVDLSHHPLQLLVPTITGDGHKKTQTTRRLKRISPIRLFFIQATKSKTSPLRILPMDTEQYKAYQ